MLRLLLDEHVSPAVAKGLHRKCKNLFVLGLSEWEEGEFLGVSDEVILEEAAAQKLTLVTYDLKTIPPLLKKWMEAGHDHGGVIFVDNKTIPSSDIGALVHALEKLFQDSGTTHWMNQVFFLRR